MVIAGNIAYADPHRLSVYPDVVSVAVAPGRSTSLAAGGDSAVSLRRRFKHLAFVWAQSRAPCSQPGSGHSRSTGWARGRSWRLL